MLRKGRLSYKRSDTRWVSPTDGDVWASKKEWEIYEQFIAAGARCRRTVKGSSDTFAFTRKLRSSQCMECGSTGVVQLCTYTPDLLVEVGEQNYWVETKGYFQQEKRAAFRDFRKAHPRVDMRIVAFSNHKVGKARLLDYLAKYVPDVPVILWPAKGGQIPAEWLL